MVCRHSKYSLICFENGSNTKQTTNKKQVSQVLDGFSTSNTDIKMGFPAQVQKSADTSTYQQCVYSTRYFRNNDESDMLYTGQKILTVVGTTLLHRKNLQTI